MFVGRLHKLPYCDFTSKLYAHCGFCQHMWTTIQLTTQSMSVYTKIQRQHYLIFLNTNDLSALISNSILNADNITVQANFQLTKTPTNLELNKNHRTMFAIRRSWKNPCLRSEKHGTIQSRNFESETTWIWQ